MIGELPVSFEAVSINPPTLLEVRTGWPAPPKQPGPFLPAALMEKFLLLAHWGAFTGPLRKPHAASAALQKSQMTDREGYWLYSLTEADPGAARVAENLLVFSHRLIAPLDRLAIRSGLSASSKKPAAPAGHVEPAPFACDVALDGVDLQVCVETAAEPTEPQGEQLSALLKAWAYVTAAGGFEAGVANIQAPFLIAPEDPEWVNNELWLSLEDFSAEEPAVDALVNALAGVHTRLLRVSALRIE